MTTHCRTAARGLLIGIAYLGLALRMVIPAGYMPAPLAEGGPIVLCPGGLAGKALTLAAGHGEHGKSHHHDHGQPGGAEADGWELCPIGILLGVAIVGETEPLQALTLRHAEAPLAEAVLLSASDARPYRARAPPTAAA